MSHLTKKSNIQSNHKIVSLRTKRISILEILSNKISQLYQNPSSVSQLTDAVFPLLLIGRILSETNNLIFGKVDKEVSSTLNLYLKEIITFTLNQKTELNTWNYWSKNSSSALENPFPDDLDDTFNALFVLLKNESVPGALVTPKILGSMVRTLISSEMTSEGPHTSYNTWISNDPKFRDRDPVVQVIIFRVLEHINSVPEKFKAFIKAYLENILDTIINTPLVPVSKYYISNAYVLSEISFLSFVDKEKIRTAIHAFEDGRFYSLLNNPNNAQYPDQETIDTDELFIAQAKENICTYETLTSDTIDESKMPQHINKYTYTLTSKFSKLYIESTKNDDRIYAGSQHLDTAFQIRYLATLVDKIDTEIKRLKTQEIYTLIFNDLYIKLYRFISISPNKESVQRIIDTVFKGNGEMIIQELISELYDFSENLTFTNTDPVLSTYQLADICKIQIYGWISYTISDMCIDHEIESTYIGICLDINMYMHHEIQRIIRRIKTEKQHDTTYLEMRISSVLSELHETQYNALAKFCDLNSEGSKSIGHAVAPLLLLASRKNISKEDIDNIIEFYRNSLSCRQLSDDAHDFEEDYENDTPNFVTQRIWSYSNKMNIDIHSETQEESEKSAAIKKIFCEYVLPVLKERISKFTSKALGCLDKLKPYINSRYLEMRAAEIERYRNGVLRAIVEIETSKLLT